MKKNPINLVLLMFYVTLIILLVPLKSKAQSLCTDAADYDGNIYPSVRIGYTCWLQANLKSTHYPDGRPIPGVYAYYNRQYPDSMLNIAIFGRLYNWDAVVDAVNGLDTDTNGYIQGICPDGWVLPNMTDYEHLISYGGNALKSDDPAYWLNDQTSTNTTGLSILPGGYYDPSTSASGLLMGDGFFWISDTTTTLLKPACHFKYGCPDLIFENVNRNTGYSVRCIKKLPPPPVLEIRNPTPEICQGNTAILTATPGFDIYLWNTGDTTSSITVSTPGTFSVTVTDIYGDTQTAGTQVTLHSLPLFSINPVGPFCSGNSTTLQATYNSSYQYLWSSGDTSAHFQTPLLQNTTNNVLPYTYYLTVTDRKSLCYKTDSVTINVYPVPIAEIHTPSTTVSQNKTIKLAGSDGTAPYANPVVRSTYRWADGSTRDTLPFTGSVVGTTAIYVTATNSYGCSNRNSIELTVVAYQPGDLWPDDSNPVGVVFYTTNAGTNGKIVALEGDTLINWGPSGVDVQGNSRNDGKANTDLIMNGYNIDQYPAFKYCTEYRGGGYTDWYLPALEEMMYLYAGRLYNLYTDNPTDTIIQRVNKTLAEHGYDRINREADSDYWSSTQNRVPGYVLDWVHYLRFSNGYAGDTRKTDLRKARPVRQY